MIYIISTHPWHYTLFASLISHNFVVNIIYLYLLHSTPINVLGILLFIHNELANCWHTVKHHLYADYIQLFVSFSASTFWQNISHLTTTIDIVSTWMPTNLLSIYLKLDSFFFQLYKIYNSLLICLPMSLILQLILHVMV